MSPAIRLDLELLASVVGKELLALVGLDLVRVVGQIADLAGGWVDIVRSLVNHVGEVVGLDIHAVHSIVKTLGVQVVDEIYFVVVDGVHVVEMGLVVLGALLGDSLVASSDIGVVSQLLLPSLRVFGIVLLPSSLQGHVIWRLMIPGSLTIALNDLSLILSFVLFELLT